MDKKEEMKKHMGLVSTILLDSAAVIFLIIGIILVINGISEKSRISSPTINLNIYCGITCIISSLLMFVIAIIADDIHYQSYLQEYMVEKNEYYHRKSLQKLESIEAMLQQLDQPPKGSKKPRHNSYLDL